MKLNENQSEMFFRMTDPAILESFDRYIANKVKFKTVADAFLKAHGFETDRYYALTRELRIVPNGNDYANFGSQFATNKPGVFKKTSALSKEWVALCTKEGLYDSSPFDPAIYATGIHSHRTTRCFKWDGILYGSIQTGRNFNMPDNGFEYMKGSEFYALLEKIREEEADGKSGLY